MQDREVVAAIVAGDPDGIAAAYDQYAASLYASCRLMLPDPADAAGAVRDTFLISTSRLEGLRDPDRLGAWLAAVARNECLRRLSAAGVTSPLPKVPGPVDGDGDGAAAVVEPPAGLRGQVLAVCADNSPAGRADRASAAHRAGAFGPAGFPRAFGPAGFPRAFGSSGPRWWRPVRGRRRTVAAVAALTAAAAAGLVVMLAVGGSHRAHAATLALGGTTVGSSGSGSASPAGSPTQGRAASSPSSPAPGQPTPSVTAPGGITDPGSPPGQVTPSAPASSPSSSASPSASSSPSPSPSATSLPTQGTLSVTPDVLVLSTTSGKTVSGTFRLSATGGPVRNYTITVPAAMAGEVKVSPAEGSLSASGWVTVTVTVTSKVAIKTQITVNPGPLYVAVTLTIKT
jgi:hypothetical protein